MAYNPDQPRNPKGTVDGGTWRKADTRHRDADMTGRSLGAQFAALNDTPNEGGVVELKVDGFASVKVTHGVCDDVFTVEAARGTWGGAGTFTRRDLVTHGDSVDFLTDDELDALRAAERKLPPAQSTGDPVRAQRTAFRKWLPKGDDPKAQAKSVLMGPDVDHTTREMASDYFDHPRKKNIRSFNGPTTRRYARNDLRKAFAAQAVAHATREGLPDPKAVGEEAEYWFDQQWPGEKGDPVSYKPTPWTPPVEDRKDTFTPSLVERMRREPDGWRASWMQSNDRSAERPIRLVDGRIVAADNPRSEHPCERDLYDSHYGMNQLVNPDSVHVWREGDQPAKVTFDGVETSGRITRETDDLISVEEPDGTPHTFSKSSPLLDDVTRY